MTIDPADFRKVLGHFPTGVMVVTGATDEGPAGMAIGSFASVSLEPPLVMFCPGSSSGTWQAIKETGAFCANILGEDQRDTCGVFAMPSDVASPASSGPLPSPVRRCCPAWSATSIARSTPSTTVVITTSLSAS